ncbi:Ceramide synthase 6 [Sarcoptes scabiei]|uniref:Ceramide synthase 6 n=1 Tax=Sarcoptes scabiei TaxID=52283 RepID=A0A834V9Q3_SARSC|nr:Ceramide synthase 6 [Sarcoptes scabiei]
MFENFRKSFWNEDVWTPPNVTWEHYETKGYRHFNDIYYSAYTAIVIILLRLILNRFVLEPFGIWMGLSPDKPKLPVHNEILEKAFKRTRGQLSNEETIGLSKQLDCTERKIQRWMRHRISFNKPTVLSKFTESAWRCLFYFSTFIYGLFVLWNKPWMWDSVWCFIDYPHHYVSNEEWWYYNIETAFYLSLLLTQFFDVQRKDFWVMFVHHAVTLCLLSFSWACNLVRIGTLVLVIHDFADVPLEGAKMMSYVKKKQIADIIFNIFAICWIVSRIGLLPYRIIYYSSYVALGLVPMFSAYYIFNSLLVALQCLHIIWTYFIVRVAIQAWNNNGIKDIRSDDENDDADDEIETDESTEDQKSSLKNNSNNNNTLHQIGINQKNTPAKVHINGFSKHL